MSQPLDVTDSKRDVLVPAPIEKPSIEMAAVSAGAKEEGRTVPCFFGSLPNPIRQNWCVVGVGTFPAWTATAAQRGPITRGYAPPSPEHGNPHDFKIGVVMALSRSDIDRTREALRHLWWRVTNLSGSISPGYGLEVDFKANRYYDLAAELVEARQAEQAGLSPKPIKPASKEEAKLIDALKREDLAFLSRLAEQPRIGAQPHDVPVACMVWLEEFSNLEAAYQRQNSFEYGSGRYPEPLVKMKPEWAGLLVGFQTTFEARQKAMNAEARASVKKPFAMPLSHGATPAGPMAQTQS